MTCSLRFLCSLLALSTAAQLAVAQTAPQPASPVHRAALLRLGLGSCLNGSGDYGVTKLQVEYAPQFGRHLRLGSRLALISGSEPYDFGEGYVVAQSYRALNVEQEAYWVPFGVNRAVEFSVGVGAFGGYGNQKGIQQGGLRRIDAYGNFLSEPVLEYVPLRESGLHVGYIASLNFDIGLNQERTWRVGTRASLQNDTDANILPGIQFQLSRAW